MMKKIFLYAILSISLLQLGCDADADRITFNPNSDEPALISFEDATANLNVLINDSSTVDITVSSNVLSNTDRQINLIINEDVSNADASYFNLPSTVTIPANEFTGTFTVTGMDPLGQMASPQTLVVTTENSENASSSRVNITISIVCPVEDTEFVGDYLLTNTTAVDFGNLYADGQTVTITAGENLGERMFDAVVLEDLGVAGQAATTLMFGLVCNSITLIPNQPTDLSCGEALLLGPPIGDVSGMYETGDDSSFSIVIGYNESGQATCAVPSDAVITLTKL